MIAFNDRGEVLTSLHDTDDQQLKEITSVNPHDGSGRAMAITRTEIDYLASASMNGNHV